MVQLATAIGPVDYSETGPRTGPAVIFLHHGFGTRLSLAGLAKRLGESLPDHRLVHYSRPGCGTSPPMSPRRPPDYLTREATSVLPCVLDALGVAEAHLVGHSDGGSIALIAAAMRPDCVRSVTAIAPHVIVEDRTLEGIRALPGPGCAPEFRRALSRKHTNISVAYDSWRNLWLSPDMKAWTITPLLGRIRCPVRLVQGAKDAFGSFRQLDLIEAAIDDTKAVSIRLNEAGHEPQKSHPEVVAHACFDAIVLEVQ